MNTEEIKTQFVEVVANVIDIYEKTSKFTSKDIDSLITNVVILNKKNMLLKKMYDLEDEIGKLKMLITKANFQSAGEQKEDSEKTPESDPQQPNEEKEEKPKKTKAKPKKDEKAEVVETPKPVVEVEDKKEKKVKTTKKKEEAPEKPVEEPVVPKEEVKSKATKKKKEEKVEPPKVEEVVIETDDSNTTVDESQQPLHVRRKKIPKQIKTLVWNEYIGHDIMSNKCLCCKKEKIDVRNFHCGHVIAESKGGDLTIKNLRPICAPCNLSMGAMSMNEFTKTFFGWEV